MHYNKQYIYKYYYNLIIISTAEMNLPNMGKQSIYLSLYKILYIIYKINLTCEYDVCIYCMYICLHYFYIEVDAKFNFYLSNVLFSDNKLNLI